MFRRLPLDKSASQLKKPLTELTKMEVLDSLLKAPKYQVLLNEIENHFVLESGRYESHCAALIQRMMLYCEFLPESTNSYYAERGGLIEYALQRTESALSLFSAYLIVEEESGLSELQQCWQYALFSAAMLYGIGKLYLDYDIDLHDIRGGFINKWNPLIDNLILQAPFYKCQIQYDPELTFRRRLNSLLAQMIIPKAGFDWLASYPEIFEAWLALLNEDTQGVKILGALLSRADQMALAKAIARWLKEQGEAKPKSFRTFEQPGIDSTKDLAHQAGLLFLEWLKQQLEQGELVLNEGGLNLSKEGLTINADLFKLFVKDFPTYKSWQAVQKGFLSLGFHDASVDTAEILFTKFGIMLPSKARFYNGSMGTKTWVGAVELMKFASEGGSVIKGKTTESLMNLPKLDAKGDWQLVEGSSAFLKPGQPFRG
jgi:integrating conjugative element relaxase (TIGR03760 family)